MACCGSAPGPSGYVDPANPGGHWEGGDPWNNDRKWVPNQPSVFQNAADAQARANRPNQNTPYASSGWTKDPKTGEWTQNVGFNPALSGANSEMQDQLTAAWSNPLDNGQQARQHAEDALYGRETSRLDPMWQQRQHDFETQLANQGIDPNSAAGQQAHGNFDRGRNDAYSTAMQDAIGAGGQEASRQQQMDLTSRMAPLMGMHGMQALLQMPQFQQGPQYLAAAMADTQARQQQDAQSNAWWADLFSGLSGLGGSVLRNPNVFK
jgi:hypothetical protein